MKSREKKKREEVVREIHKWKKKGKVGRRKALKSRSFHIRPSKKGKGKNRFTSRKGGKKKRGVVKTFSVPTPNSPRSVARRGKGEKKKER